MQVISEGTDAPGFELPGLIDGAHRRVALDEFLGRDVVILAFYPADFNPACDDDSDLDELDLFTMQKDVTVLAVGPDSLYSHAAFADAYGLHVPLLADTDHDVAEAYGVDFEDDLGQHLVERAVFVVDHDGVVQYAWSTRDLEERPRSDEIKDAIAETGGDDTAFARYRVGHAHYTEARRAFTSAMASYRDAEWMMAQSDFKRAREEFEESAEHFDSAVRFVDDEEFAAYYGRTQEKATALWQAADWLGKSASAYASGSGAEGQQLRDDAEKPLETARDIGEPVDPDDWPPEVDEDDDGEHVLPQDEERDVSLTVDVEDELQEEADDDDEGSVETGPLGEGCESGDDGGEGGKDEEGDDTIDDAELEEIEAELAASQPENPAGDELEETPTSMVDAPPAADDWRAEEGETVDDEAGGGEGTDNESTGDGSDDGDANDGDIDGEVGEAELEALEAELAANQPDGDPEEQSDDERPNGERPDDERTAGDDGSAGRGEELRGGLDGPADPHADLSVGPGPAGGSSGSLEPGGDFYRGGAGTDDVNDGANSGGDDNDGEGLDGSPTDPGDGTGPGGERDRSDGPGGASDGDLSDIPTTADLEADDGEAADGPGDGGTVDEEGGDGDGGSGSDGAEGGGNDEASDASDGG